MSVKFLLIINYNLNYKCGQIMHPEKEGEGAALGSKVDFVDGLDELDDFSTPRSKKIVLEKIKEMTKEVFRDWQRLEKLKGEIHPIVSMDVFPFLHKVKNIAEGTEVIKCEKKGEDRLGSNFVFEELDKVNWEFKDS